MDKGIIPHSGIDTAARWGYSHTKGWIFGYKPHLISSTGLLYRLLISCDVTTANVYDNQVYQGLVSCLSSITIKKIHYMIADPAGYDDQNLYDLSTNFEFSTCMSCPSIQKYTARKTSTG